MKGYLAAVCLFAVAMATPSKRSETSCEPPNDILGKAVGVCKALDQQGEPVSDGNVPRPEDVIVQNTLGSVQANVCPGLRSRYAAADSGAREVLRRLIQMFHRACPAPNPSHMITTICEAIKNNSAPDGMQTVDNQLHR